MNEDKLAALAKAIDRFHRKIGAPVLIVLLVLWVLLRTHFSEIADSYTICVAMKSIVCE